MTDTGADDDVSAGDDERSPSSDPGPAADRATEADGGSAEERESPGTRGTSRDRERSDPETAGDEVAELREELDALRTRIDEKTVHRDDIRAELRRYVRKRQRRGHATGWGPYVVLLYGTAMTVAAFYYLGNWAAVAAMLVVWLSTLGLYVFMVVVGSFLAAGRKAAGLRDLVGKFR
ncbi:ribonuclease BN [Halosimplex amylolyticum]|uniref:ribonuclease BN n=1 Tax=Halosimplex amylolyticum TaxID=3396616 RepID=UPI003F5517A5